MHHIQRAKQMSIALATIIIKKYLHKTERRLKFGTDSVRLTEFLNICVCIYFFEYSCKDHGTLELNFSNNILQLRYLISEIFVSQFCSFSKSVIERFYYRSSHFEWKQQRRHCKQHQIVKTSSSSSIGSRSMLDDVSVPALGRDRSTSSWKEEREKNMVSGGNIMYRILTGLSTH
jgi:hypothetical protein